MGLRTRPPRGVACRRFESPVLSFGCCLGWRVFAVQGKSQSAPVAVAVAVAVRGRVVCGSCVVVVVIAVWLVRSYSYDRSVATCSSVIRVIARLPRPVARRASSVQLERTHGCRGMELPPPLWQNTPPQPTAKFQRQQQPAAGDYY